MSASGLPGSLMAAPSAGAAAPGGMSPVDALRDATLNMIRVGVRPIVQLVQDKKGQVSEDELVNLLDKLMINPPRAAAPAPAPVQNGFPAGLVPAPTPHMGAPMLWAQQAGVPAAMAAGSPGQCKHIGTRGATRNVRCTRPVVPGTEYCKSHSKSSQAMSAAPQAGVAATTSIPSFMQSMPGLGMMQSMPGLGVMQPSAGHQDSQAAAGKAAADALRMMIAQSQGQEAKAHVPAIDSIPMGHPGSLLMGGAVSTAPAATPALPAGFPAALLGHMGHQS